MWLCPKCKKENDDKTIICPQCGFDESRNPAEYCLLSKLSDKECQAYSDNFEKKLSEDNLIEKYKKLAEQGNREAQKILENCYYYGRGVEQDYAEAARWRQCAEDEFVTLNVKVETTVKNDCDNQNVKKAEKIKEKGSNRGETLLHWNMQLFLISYTMMVGLVMIVAIIKSFLILKNISLGGIFSLFILICVMSCLKVVLIDKEAADGLAFWSFVGIVINFSSITELGCQYGFYDETRILLVILVILAFFVPQIEKNLHRA